MQGDFIGLWLISKGLMAGLAIAVPVGPVNVLCASRTLSKGRLSGLMSGFGAATADALYGAIAGFSITYLIEFLEREEFWIRVVGGVLLVGIGVMYFRKPPAKVNPEGDGSDPHSDYASTLLLTLTNPTTVLSFVAVLAGLGMSGQRQWWLTFLLSRWSCW
jgi:threonine/homoserine/homoserine lactone efflux protein